MTNIDQLYAEFVQAWQDGLAPEVDAYLDRADADDQDALAERIETFVMVAPSVELSPDRAAQIEASPAFLRALEIPAAAGSVGWAAQLRAARERAGLSLSDLGARFAEAFGHGGGAAKAATLIGQLEDGTIAPTGVSTPAAGRLAELLGLASGALAPPRPQALFRAERGRLDPGTTASPPPADFVADFALALDAHPDWDELDWLLRGGD
ncbi:unannotated protein [freshwater metagenome]|uniref:Unannotated protein n=1 Tax=freshwater metagenome TaxID=449393 RepID=A0A6J7IR54_9ZZZZ|nr:hypothetical protein [Actinomycetota bacterium]